MTVDLDRARADPSRRQEGKIMNRRDYVIRASADDGIALLAALTPAEHRAIAWLAERCERAGGYVPSITIREADDNDRDAADDPEDELTHTPAPSEDTP